MTHCTDCDGIGETRVEDYDEHGAYIVYVTCEACQGAGELSECLGCREPAPPPELDQFGGRCMACASEGLVTDLANELVRLGKRVA